MKKCSVCGETFKQFTTMQNKCIPCAIELSKELKIKNRLAKAKKKTADKKEAKKKIISDKSYQKEKSSALVTAQSNFNRYIRTRDHEKGCISCGQYQETYHAGHYLGIGSYLELRFEPLNCHLQCKKCNIELSGNKTEYRERLLVKIGKEKLAWLEGPHKIPKLSIVDIKEISEKYKILSRNIVENKESWERIW